MSDGLRDRLADQAALDDRARDTVAALPDEAVEQLHAAWSDALRRQQQELDDAIEGSLGLLPRLLRRRVARMLTGGRR